MTIIAYEETKGGGEGVDFGKVVRYHRFTFDQPPASYINVAFSSGLQKGGSSTGNSKNQNQPGAKGNFTDDDTVYNGEDVQVSYPDTEGVVSDVYQSPDWEDPARIGCVLSNPAENARRVRFFYNQVAGMDETINQSGTKLMVFWKEGAYDQGATLLTSWDRIGVVGEDATNTGLTPLDFTPAVDTSFTTFTRYVLTSTGTVVYPDGVGGYVDGIGNVVEVADGDAVLDVTYEEAGGCNYFLTDADRDHIPPITLSDRISNPGAVNLSTNAFAEVTTDDSTKTIEALTITTENNNLEDARAHRGAIRGDTILFGYSYTSDWALAKYTTEDNYNFFTRRSYDGGNTWTGTQNLTNYLPALEVDIKEPRIVGAPSSTSACDLATAPDGENCQDPNAFIVAWGSIKNTLAHIGTGTELDVFVTKTRDGGRTYEPLKLLSANITVPLDPEGEPDFESQLRMKPNGDNLYAVWMETSTDEAGYEDTVVRYRAEADLEDAGAPMTLLDDGTYIYNYSQPITVDQGSVTGLVVSSTTATGTDYTYPMPQFSYNVTGLAEGSTISVTINFGSALPTDFALLKVKDDGSTVVVAEDYWELIGDNLIQVSITDGGELDEDGEANGTIVDPVTVGVLTSTATTTSGSSSGGSVGLLELLLGVFGLGLLTRRSKN
ncbi:choice-of-anchor O protein [Paucibacter sp. O1-1]|nr:choice-of-anchor O protein [Paucibacter sp. O1-1]MDA3828020.1 choice-of-anchor O protein [Paucibacter sp. O1-1]